MNCHFDFSVGKWSCSSSFCSYSASCRIWGCTCSTGRLVCYWYRRLVRNTSPNCISVGRRINHWKLVLNQFYHCSLRAKGRKVLLSPIYDRKMWNTDKSKNKNELQLKSVVLLRRKIVCCPPQCLSGDLDFHDKIRLSYLWKQLTRATTSNMIFL